MSEEENVWEQIYRWKCSDTSESQQWIAYRCRCRQDPWLSSLKTEPVEWRVLALRQHNMRCANVCGGSRRQPATQCQLASVKTTRQSSSHMQYARRQSLVTCNTPHYITITFNTDNTAHRCAGAVGIKCSLITSTSGVTMIQKSRTERSEGRSPQQG